jgi:xanthosine utilization system XapX-like protein
VLAGLLDLIANVLVGTVLGAIPERQPWRTLVAALYVLGALAGAGVIVWTITSVV